MNSTKAYLCNELSWAFHMRNIDSAAFYAQTALEAARKSSYAAAEAKALNLQAVVSYILQRPTEAFTLNRKALKIAESTTLKSPQPKDYYNYMEKGIH